MTRFNISITKICWYAKIKSKIHFYGKSTVLVHEFGKLNDNVDSIKVNKTNQFRCNLSVTKIISM